MPRLLAIDPSLTCSGWALFDIGAEQLLALGKIKAPGTSFTLAERLNSLQRDVRSLFIQASLGPFDVLICEAPTTMRDPSAAIKVEQVRSVFEVVARERTIQVPGRINPRSVQFELLGMRGKQAKREEVKSSARELVARLYQKKLLQLGLCCDNEGLKKHQDLVDAILVGRLALSRIQTSRATKEPLDFFFQNTNGRGRYSVLMQNK